MPRPKTGYTEFLEAGHTEHDLREAVAFNVFGGSAVNLEEGSILKLSFYPSEHVTWVIWGCIRMLKQEPKVTGFDKHTNEVQYEAVNEVDISFYNERAEAEAIRTLLGIDIPFPDVVRKFKINMNEEYADA
jgi:hypothetical protein